MHHLNRNPQIDLPTPHKGLAAGIPTIGVAKTFLHVDGLDAHGVRRAANAQREGKGADDWLPLVGESGRVRTLRS